MGRDALQVGVQIRRFVIITTRICCRSVCNHPVLVGVVLFLLFLYRSSPILFSLLVSFSPILVCTAVLLGTLLSFGESNVIEKDEKTTGEIAELKTGSVENTICFEKDESSDRDIGYTDLWREIVERTTDDEEPVLDSIYRVDKFERDGDFPHSSLSTDQNSRDIQFETQPIDKINSEFVDLEIEPKASVDNQIVQVGIVDVGLFHDEALQNVLSRNSLAENFEDYKSAEGSVDDIQTRDQLDTSVDIQTSQQPDDVLDDNLSPVLKVDASSNHDEVLENEFLEKVQVQNFEDYRSAEGSVDSQTRAQSDSSAGSCEQSDDVLEDSLSPVQKFQAAVLAQLRNQLESSLGSWNPLDAGVVNRGSVVQKVQGGNFEDYISAEGSADAQITDQLESSFRSWKQLGSDRDDDDDESDSGSDGAESSSPDASMADIIPMLDELHPLLEDENPQTSNLSRQSSAATMTRSGKSRENSIHSGDESDQKEEEVGDIKSDADDDDDEEIQGSKEDPEKSAISWTEDDQKNLMDLGTSELERNQRLESLIARRRARRMMTERNLIDLDGMDIQFLVTPISTTRQNPFDLPHDSYDDLGLPPIPGSAPSIMQPSRNPFDLPYDSSEEKPDLMADGFQEEFMELCQGEATNHREAVFRRNETFSAGSSIFNFGRHDGRDVNRASRFRPYFIPERTDSDVMSYSSSLRRQSSELSESKASSAAETESIFPDGDEEENKRGEHEYAQEMDPSLEIDQALLLAELGSQTYDDLHSLSDKEKKFVLYVPEIELGGAGTSPAADSFTLETEQSAEITMADRGVDAEAEFWMSDREISTCTMRESTEEKHSTCTSALSLEKDYGDVNVDVNEGLVNREQRQVDNTENVVMLLKYELGRSVSDIPSEHSLEISDYGHGTEVGDDNTKEPVYDSSPQAVKKSHSSSSISSDLRMERSEIYLCEVPSLRRDLLMTEEPKIHDEDAEQSDQDKTQGLDENGPAMKENKEGDGCEIRNQLQLSEVPTYLEASVVPEYELHMSTDTSDSGLIKDKTPDDKVSKHVGMQVPTLKDDAGDYMKANLDTFEDEDHKASAVCDRNTEDLILTPEGKDASILEYSASPVQSESSSLTVEFREEIVIEKEAEASHSNIMNYDNDVIEKPVAALDESCHFPHDSAIDEWSENPEEQKPSIDNKLEEFSQVNNVDETPNVVLDEDDILLNPLQSIQPFFEPNEFEMKPTAEFTDNEHVDSSIHQEVGASGGDENVIYDFNSDMMDMDDDLLSELDAVGDFSVKDMRPNIDLILAYSNGGFDSNELEQATIENHLNIGIPSEHDTSLRDYAGLQHSEPMIEIIECNVSGFEESNLDSNAGDSSSGLLVVEAPFVEDIDTAFKRETEGDIENSMIYKSVEAELTRELVDAPTPEMEFLLKEPETHVTEVASPKDSGAVDHSEQVEKLGSFLGPSVLEAEVSAQDDDDLENFLENETGTLNIGEASKRETGIDSVEPVPLHINRDVKEMPEFSVVEASVDPAIVSESLQTDNQIIEIQDLTLVEVAPPPDSVDQIEMVGSVESRSMLIEGVGSVGTPVVEARTLNSADNNDEIETVSVESPVLEARVIPRNDFEDQLGGVGSVKSGSSLIDEDTNEIQESSVDEESIASVVDSEDQLEKVGHVESESLPIDRDVNGTQESVELELGDRTEGFGSMDSETLHIARRESVSLFVEERSVSSFDNEDETRRISSEESPVEASIISSLDSEDLQGVHSVESRSMLVDEEIKGRQEPPADEQSKTRAVDSEDQLKKIDLESESFPLDQVISETQELPVGDFGPAAKSGDQTEGVDSIEAESFHIDSVESGLHIVEANSVPSVDNEDEIEPDGSIESPVVEACIIPSLDSEDQLVGLVGSVEYVSSTLIDEDTNEIQTLPSYEQSIAPAVDSEDQAEKVGYAESESSPLDREIDDMQESSVREISPSPSAEPGDQTEGFISVESESGHVDSEIKELQEWHVVEASNPHLVESKRQEERIGLMEVESLSINQPNIESEYEKDIVGSAESKLSQMDADIKGIPESPVMEASIIAAASQSEDQTGGSPHTEVTEVQVVQDHQLVSWLESDCLLSGVDDALVLTNESTSEKLIGQESDKSATEKPFSQVNEGVADKSHLESSTSSS